MSLPLIRFSQYEGVDLFPRLPIERYPLHLAAPGERLRILALCRGAGGSLSRTLYLFRRTSARRFRKLLL
jgi:hypothetical protein